MKEKITLSLAIIKVDPAVHWSSCEYVKEHFPKGHFIIDDGSSYFFAVHNGDGYLSTMPIERDMVQDAIIEDTRQEEFQKSLSIIDAIEDRLQQIARLTGECKDEVLKSENRLTAAIVEQSARQITEFNIIREVLEILEKGENIIMDLIPESEARLSEKIGGLASKGSGDGVNILDVAKSFAVIQKPELIEKL